MFSCTTASITCIMNNYIYLVVMGSLGILLTPITYVNARACSSSSTCNCSMETIEAVPGKQSFVLECAGDVIGVSNASLADVFKYTTTYRSSVLDTNLLADFKNLKVLYIDKGLPNLKSISEMNSIKILDIHRSELTYLKDRAISEISMNIISLSLAYNDIDTVHNEAFFELPKLIHLNLSYNNMGKIPSAAIRPLNVLEVLDLSHNRIRAVSTKDISDLKSLEQLSLAYNKIFSLEYVKFPSSNVAFNVSYNPIKQLRWNAASRTNIHILDLSGTDLVELSPSTFNNCDIKEIRITNSRNLEMVDYDVFPNSSVNTIIISNNPQLRYIDPMAFQRIQTLSVLDLRNNALRLIPQSFSLIRNIKEIHISGNLVSCDCNMFWSTKDTKVLSAPACTITSPETECAPQTVYRSANVTVVDEGATVTLKCKASGLPPPSVSWLYGERPLPTDTNMQVVKGDLRISHSKVSDSGVYVCAARNSQGSLIERFNFTVTPDKARIIILKIGKDFVVFSWRVTNLRRRYKAILIDVKMNNQTSYSIRQFTTSRHSQSGFTISKLRSETTYRVCLAYENQLLADSDKCETITTLDSSEDSSARGITDYRLYGIVVASIVSFIVLCIIVCVCITSKNYSNRKRRELMKGMVSESSYGLMTTSFSQRSGLSAMYDNPGVSITPVSHLSRSSSYYKFKRNLASTAATPTSPTVCFSPDVIFDRSAGDSYRSLKRTVSDPLLCASMRSDDNAKY